MRVVAADHAGDRLPAVCIGSRRQLPPVGANAGRVQLLQGAGQGGVVTVHLARRNHLDQQFVKAGDAGVLQGGEGKDLLYAQLGRIVGVIRHQALGDMLARPGTQGEGGLVTRFEAQRTRARQLDRPRHPPADAGDGRQNILTESIIEDHAIVEIAGVVRQRRALFRSRRNQALEAGNFAGRRTMLRSDLVELRTVVERQYREFGPVARARTGAVQVFERHILAHARAGGTVFEEILQLFPTRHRRRTTVARHHQGTAGIGIGAAARQVFVAQPAGQEARHEGIAGAEDVEHLDRKARPHDAGFDVAGYRTIEYHAAHRPALDHDGAFCQRAQFLKRRQGIGAAAGDMDFFFGADQQVALGDHRLQMRAHLVGRHEALLAHARAGEAPQHRAVIDVERDARALLFRHAHRSATGFIRLRLRQVGARDQQSVGRADEGRIEILLRNRHVGAVVAVEHQREGIAVADAEEYQGGKFFRVGDDMAHIHAFGGKKFAHETAVVFIANAGEHGRLQPEARDADRGVGRRAAHVFVEGQHVFEAAADLLAVEVDRRAANADDIELALHVRFPFADFFDAAFLIGMPRTGCSAR